MKSILNVKTFFFILILACSVSEIYGRGRGGSSSSGSYGSKSSGSSKSSSIGSSGSGGSSKTSNSENSGSVKSSGTSNSGNSAFIKSSGASNSGSSSVSSSGTSNSGSFGSGRSYGTSNSGSVNSGSFGSVNSGKYGSSGSFGDNSIHYRPKGKYGFPPNYGYGMHRSNSGLRWNLNDYDSKYPERHESTLSDIENLKFDYIYRPTTSSYESWPIIREPGLRSLFDGFKTHSSDFGSYENERVMKDIMAGTKEMRDASMNFGRIGRFWK